MALTKLLKTIKHTGETISLVNEINKFLTQYSANPSQFKPLNFDFPDTTDRHNDGRIHPSFIHLCPRYVVYKLLKVEGAKKVISSQLQRIFDNGTMVHNRIQAYFYNMGILDSDYKGRVINGIEVGLRDKVLNIGGSSDAVVKLYSKRFVVEIKSINSRAFYGLQKPKREHLWQGNTYMMVLDIPSCIFLYEAKDTQELKEFILYRDEQMVDNIRHKCKRCNEWASQGVVPERNPELTQSYCKDCEMFKACYSDKYPEVENDTEVYFEI